MRRVLTVCALTLVVVSCNGDTTDEVNPETEAIINEWIDAWKAEDAMGVGDLYAEDGVYVDAGCPFESVGRVAIRTMAYDHLQSTDYEVAEKVEVTYTDTGAVVQWVWAGLHDGAPFSMEPSTTFEIENGLIVRSTDTYDRADAPPGWEAACIALNS